MATVIIVYDYPTTGESTRLFFLPYESLTDAEMDTFGNGAIRLGNIDVTPPPPVCFASGTLIGTPQGMRRVEDLKAGDMVLTADGASMPIAWASETYLEWPGSPESHRPISISAGSFGAVFFSLG